MSEKKSKKAAKEEEAVEEPQVEEVEKKKKKKSKDKEREKEVEETQQEEESLSKEERKAKRKLEKQKEKDAEEESNSKKLQIEVHTANNWEEADLGNDERKLKFLKLMGATKVSARYNNMKQTLYLVLSLKKFLAQRWPPSGAQARSSRY